MNAAKPNMSWKSHLRITAAITGKDILDAIRNKNIIGLLASVLFIVVFYRFLPCWRTSVENPYLLVYDAGRIEPWWLLGKQPGRGTLHVSIRRWK